MKKSFLLFFLLLIITVTASACSLKPGDKADAGEEVEETVIDVETTMPVRKDLSVSSDFSGNVQADNTIIVIPKVAGEVIEKNYEVGDHVNEGDLLFAIDDTTAQITLKQAEATLASAKAGYTSQQATSASTIAQATETYGKIGTNEAQLSNAVDSAYAGKVQAGGSFDTAKAAVEFYDDSYDRAKDSLDNAKKTRDAANETVNAIQRQIDSGAYTPEELEDLLDGLAVAKAAAAQAEGAVTQAEAAVDSAKLQKRTNENSARSAEMQYYVAQEGYDAAIRNQQDYEIYTKNTTLYGVNAQIHGAEAGLTSAESNVKQAEAALENAKLALDYTKVKAPASGIITAINISLHNMASQTTQAYVIQSDAKNKIVFYVAEETVRNMSVGNEALITRNQNTYRAVISSVSDTLDTTTGLFRVEATVTGDDTTLVSGSVVSVRTITRQSPNAMTVPVNAVYYDEEQPYVYLDENNVAVRRDIVTGLTDSDSIEVVAGLEGNERIISSYSTQLHEGVKVNIASAPEVP